MLNCGSDRSSARHLSSQPATPALCNQVVPACRLNGRFCPEPRPPICITLTTPAVKPSRKNTMSPQGDVDSKRSKPQPISRSDDNAGDQFGRKPETARHRRCSGSAVSASSSGLVSPDVAAVPNFGQPVIQTSEPCGKRSFIGGRFVAISISAVRSCRQPCCGDPKRCCVDGNYARHPQKPRGPY